MKKKNFQTQAMASLVEGLTSAPVPVSSHSTRRGRKSSTVEVESVCTTVPSFLYKKVKMISSIENIPIKDIFNKGLEYIVSAYEEKKGVLTVPESEGKGDLNKILDL